MANWEFVYNGLTFGGATQYGIITVEGLAPPDAKVDISPKIAVDGSFVWSGYYQERHVIINGDIVPTSGLPTDLEPLVNTWRTTFANQTTDLNLDYTLPGQAVRRIKCRPIRRAITVDTMYAIGMALWLVELVAADPGIYNTSDVKIYNG